MAKQVKVSVAQKTMKDPDLINMFNQMVGASDPDPTVVVPKYERIVTLATEVVGVLESFCRSPCGAMLRLQFEKGIHEIEEFTAFANKQLESMKLENNDKVLSGSDLNELNSNPQKMAEYLSAMAARYKVANLGEKYRRLKDCRVVQEMIMTARNMRSLLSDEQERRKTQIHDLEERDNLSNQFITKADGDFLTFLPFTCLDFKQVYYWERMNAEMNKYILYVLHLVFKKVLEIVREVTSPDIDVEKFSQLLVNSIKELKKHIPRCDKAFKKIEESVDLLKNNFGAYYKDFITSQNPGIIVENFVSDVALNSNADIQTTKQFRDIVNFYQRQMQGKVNDPKVKKMMELVGANLSILEEKQDKSRQKKQEKTEDGATKPTPPTTPTISAPAKTPEQLAAEEAYNKKSVDDLVAEINKTPKSKPAPKAPKKPAAKAAKK